MKIVRWMGVFLGTLLLSALLAGGALAAEGKIQVTPGVPVEVEKDVLYDYTGVSFSLTAQAGQTIAVEVSGLEVGDFFSSEYLNVTWANSSYRIENNGTYYLHVPQSGVQVWKLRLGSQRSEGAVRFVFKLLPGCAEELNDTLETATRLSLGTDQTFTVDGWGDEDWFTFEAAPEAGETANYTLRLLDFQTDYSDELVYDVYAPDGSVVSQGTEVNIRHTAQLACTQQGLYAVRVYTMERTRVSRNPLRIRVDEGGLDPYEPNDTWRAAAPITPGEPIPYVLSNTADQDWFCFTVPEGGMTMELHVENTTVVRLYDGAMLAQGSVDALYGFFGGTRYHFTKAGAYYLQFSTRSGNTSEAVRTFTLALEQDPDAEPNDTWKTAAPLYDGVAQKLVVSALNDEDWFRLEVPEGTQTLLIGAFSEDGCQVALYREKDFLYHGDDAYPIESNTISSEGEIALAIPVAEPGAYLLKFSPYDNDTFPSITILFRCLEQSFDDHATLDTALPGEPGKWMDCFGDTYIDLGQLPEGAIVNVEWDEYEARNSWGGDILRDDGEFVSGLNPAHTHTGGLAAGHYYLYFPGIEMLNQDGEYTTSRVRYFVGTEFVDTDKMSIAAPDSITMSVGEKTFVEVSGSPENSRWYVDSIYLQNEDSCTYDSATGYLTAKSTGQGTLVIYLRNWGTGEEITKTIPVTVTQTPSYIPTTSITITGAPDTLPLGKAAQLEAVLSEGATEPVDWKSSDPKVLYVSGKGRVTAVGLGTAEIYASTSGCLETISISVTEAAAPPESLVSGVKLSEYAMTLYCKEPGKALTATVLPQGVDAVVTWRSSNSAVAKVDQEGVVTPVAPGVAVITAGAGDYQTGCIVTVLPARERVTGVEITDAPETVPLHGEAVLTATISPEKATTQTVTWTSSDPDVAAVSRTGIVTALSVGETTITVTTVDGGFTDQITITVTAAPQMGDVNLDGYVDSGDAMLCLRAAVGAYTVPEEMRPYADLNHDGLVDAGDAVRILRYDAGLLDDVELR